MKNIFPLLLFLPVVYSCQKESDLPAAAGFSGKPGGIYISNEGIYPSGNASVSYYDPEEKKVNNEAFYQANSKGPGDVCQSITQINNSLYIVVNNSGKIEVCEPYSLKITKTITGFTSPRYVLAVGPAKAYVSDLYANKIWILNTANHTIQGNITLPGSTEKMILLNNLAYVTNSGSEFLYVIDVVNDLVQDSIFISKGANSICSDSNGKLWITCYGDYQQTAGALYRIDPATKYIEFSQFFTPTDFVSKAVMNATNDTIYFLNTNVYRMDVNATNYPIAPFVAASGNNFYGLGVDTLRNEIYVADAINFSQAGKIFRYDAMGNLVDEFNAGINPGDFFLLP